MATSPLRCPRWEPVLHTLAGLATAGLGRESEGEGEHPVAEPSGAVTVTVTWERYPRTAAADPGVLLLAVHDRGQMGAVTAARPSRFSLKHG